MSFSSDKALQSNQLPISIQYPDPDDPNFVDVLSLDRKRISDSMNTKVGGLYQLQELASFKQIFTSADPQKLRNGYRFPFDLVSLNGGVPIPPGAMAPIPHGIVSLEDPIIIYVSCRNTAGERFTVVYPYIILDDVNINFTNPSATNLTFAMLVAEYTKN